MQDSQRLGAGPIPRFEKLAVIIENLAVTVVDIEKISVHREITAGCHIINPLDESWFLHCWRLCGKYTRLWRRAHFEVGTASSSR